MFNINQYRNLIIRPALHHLQNWSAEAEELLVLTCAQESLGGTYLSQEGGLAQGIYCMEAQTYEEIWGAWMSRHSHYAYKALQSVWMNTKPPFAMMGQNIYYATIMARLNYCRFSEPIPNAKDIKALAEYYKLHWNTPLGKATVENAINNYNKFVGNPPIKAKKAG